MKDFLIFLATTIVVSHYMRPGSQPTPSTLFATEPPTPIKNFNGTGVTAGALPHTRKDTDPAHLSRGAVTPAMDARGEFYPEAPHTTTDKPDTPPAHFKGFTASSGLMDSGYDGAHHHMKAKAFCSHPPTIDFSTHPPRGKKIEA
ncbi:hypothetical protein B9Z55_023144 [Caenorhabditis nigoni]|nr:hypothetical protein B9Z55_023144 [Caenorhabditis nigoni]